MTPSKDTEITQLKIDVGIIKDQMGYNRDVIDRIEKKIDGMKYATTEDLAALIKQTSDDFKEARKYLDENFVRTETFTPIKNGIYKFLGIVATALASVLAGLLWLKK